MVSSPWITWPPREVFAAGLVGRLAALFFCTAKQILHSLLAAARGVSQARVAALIVIVIGPRTRSVSASFELISASFELTSASFELIFRAGSATIFPPPAASQ